MDAIAGLRNVLKRSSLLIANLPPHLLEWSTTSAARFICENVLLSNLLSAWKMAGSRENEGRSTAKNAPPGQKSRLSNASSPPRSLSHGKTDRRPRERRAGLGRHARSTSKPGASRAHVDARCGRRSVVTKFYSIAGRRIHFGYNGVERACIWPSVYGGSWEILWGISGCRTRERDQ